MEETTSNYEIVDEVNKLIRIWTTTENIETFDDFTHSYLFNEHIKNNGYSSRIVLKEFLYQSELPSTLKTLEFWGII